MIQLVLSAATTETDNPDLRDRAYVYWRLLSTDPEVGWLRPPGGARPAAPARRRPPGGACPAAPAPPTPNPPTPYPRGQHANTQTPNPNPQAAKDVVLAPKPVISDDASGLEPHVLSQLLTQIGSLASVYHKPADTFVSRQRLAVARADDLQVCGRVLGAPGGGAGMEAGCHGARGAKGGVSSRAASEGAPARGPRPLTGCSPPPSSGAAAQVCGRRRHHAHKGSGPSGACTMGLCGCASG
jgi:hypothetical protein